RCGARAVPLIALSDFFAMPCLLTMLQHNATNAPCQAYMMLELYCIDCIIYESGFCACATADNPQNPVDTSSFFQYDFKYLGRLTQW
ncbi:MAG: hypothetical protein J1E32_07815, partial [Treponema sp.]|nr:hypothetical protein [Treponema sp.]